MLPVLNNTRNTQVIRKKRKRFVLSVSQLCGHEIGSHVREDWAFGHVDTHRTLHWLLESTGLWLDLDTHLPLPPQRIMQVHKSLNKLPSQQKPPSFGLKLTFQVVSTTEMLRGCCSSLPAASGALHFEPGGKRLATVLCGSVRLRRKI